MLGLGIGMGVGNKVPMLPASAYPSIDAIPPGSLVLDSDGVVKECRWAFNNAGTDYINCGRPAHLISLLAPNNKYTVKTCIRTANVAQTGVVVALAGASDGTRQFSLRFYNYTIGSLVGNTDTSDLSIAAFQNKYFIVSVISTGLTHKTAINGDESQIVANGTDLYSGNLFIGGRTDGVSANFEGELSFIQFLDGNGAVVDTLDFNKWDGSGTVYFDSGHACTVTDGTPFTARAKVLVPVSLTC